MDLLAHHFWRSADDDKAVDYAMLAGEKAQRRWATTEALALFAGAGKRLGQMADMELNRRRRIDAVVKQSEIQFALGHHAEHVEALEAIRELVDAVGRSAPAGGLVLLGGLPSQPDRGPAGSRDPLLP